MLVLDGCIQLTQRDEFSYQASTTASHLLVEQPLSRKSRAGDDGAPPAVRVEGPAAPGDGGASPALASRSSMHPTAPLRQQVGGGDGGVVREVVRHACVEHVDCAEIDGVVPEVRNSDAALSRRALTHASIWHPCS